MPVTPRIRANIANAALVTSVRSIANAGSSRSCASSRSLFSRQSLEGGTPGPPRTNTPPAIVR